MISARIAQSAVRVRMQGFNLHKLNVMKSKDDKNVQTAQPLKRSQSYQWKMLSFM